MTGREWCKEENLTNLVRDHWFAGVLQKMNCDGLCKSEEGLYPCVRLLEMR